MSGNDKIDFSTDEISPSSIGRAGRTGQSTIGECYVIAHQKDMMRVKIY